MTDNQKFSEIPGLAQYLPSYPVWKGKGYCHGLTYKTKYSDCNKPIPYDPNSKFWQSPWCEECSDKLNEMDEDYDD